ncbi:MAG: YceI family protein [Bacteroidetes bacterium]|jgi:polyisoprenoid-binding protein YceI|nr:YceI family protein [Bacteroidota bacterium]MBU1579548.1 YceI family protein [Bacteroidota bacterium]MBU2465821.1 YceI family protein [Bacteroidota bacterium]MBU2557480.1 YceI family protein [Bacteroidota bacterium]
MKKSVLSIALMLLAGFAFSQSTNWKIDHAHSNVTFEVDHMVVSTVTGKFQEFEGDIKSDKDDFSDAKISFTIQAASVNTNNEKRDNHLRDEDFFEVATYPTIEFVGKKLVPVSGKKYTITGDLTMHGVTKEIELDVKYNGTIKDPWGNIRAGFKVSGELNREDYGLTWNNALEAGGVLVGEEVEIQINLELVKE